ncbi:hypothetical protein [Portibacter lacus]|uniref:Uncharacterized protein n=1 Tax=Portibacter lacus TaxID=1099794 RepID=A0AA37SM20_9BACT|nr:hypothetical protein [Portibacter lacus]GLR15847.1 hypothetical protein GCM10007940_04620 [Portibacter lacus]
MKGNKPSKKKISFPISEDFDFYLKNYNRYLELPLQYLDMERSIGGFPLMDRNGNETFWKTLIYDEAERMELHNHLCEIYALLKTDGDMKVIEHLKVDRIDFCTFGNTNPYRVRIINRLNDNYDHFYIKRIDASRIYGLELEDLLSPNRISFLYDRHTLIEEHIAGIPGDDFVKRNIDVSAFDQIRIAKEFIKFNERCFVRLLGDMRSYNYIVDITPDIDGNQYRIRAIDFDQQSYEGRKNFYLPQFFKENNEIIKLGLDHLSNETVTQYQFEERSLITRRAKTSSIRLNKLLKCMIADKLSFDPKIDQLKSELAYHHKSHIFDTCNSMGELVLANLKLVLLKEFKQSIIKF